MLLQLPNFDPLINYHMTERFFDSLVRVHPTRVLPGFFIFCSIRVIGAHYDTVKLPRGDV